MKWTLGCIKMNALRWKNDVNELDRNLSSECASGGYASSRRKALSRNVLSQRVGMGWSVVNGQYIVEECVVTMRREGLLHRQKVMRLEAMWRRMRRQRLLHSQGVPCHLSQCIPKGDVDHREAVVGVSCQPLCYQSYPWSGYPVQLLTSWHAKLRAYVHPYGSWYLCKVHPADGPNHIKTGACDVVLHPVDWSQMLLTSQPPNRTL